MSFVISGLDLSNCVLGYQQVIKPSFRYVLASSNRVGVTSDYGKAYDRYFSDIDLSLSDAQYASLVALVNGNNSLTSTLDLFIPGMVFPDNTPIGIVSIKDSGWISPETHNSNFVQIRIKLLDSSVDPIGDISIVQEFVNRGVVDKASDTGLIAPEIVSSGFVSVSNTPLERFEVTCSFLPPYKAGKIVQHYLQSRGAKFSLTLSARHCRQAGIRQVQATDLIIERTDTNFYTIGLTFTIA